jgi:hypothetical protein
METTIPTNRIEGELSNWRSREERLGKLFPFDLSNNKALLTEKLRFYESIVTTYKNTQVLEERLALRILQQEKNRIEKELYPDVLGRLLRRLYLLTVRQPLERQREVRQSGQNIKVLRGQMQDMGFRNLPKGFFERADMGGNSFKVPFSDYVNEKERIDYAFNFVRDARGNFQLDGFRAALHNEHKPHEAREHYFSMSDAFGQGITQSYNLLSGRAALGTDGKWVQLYLNDKDSTGNYHVKEFRKEYGYDLAKVLGELPLAATDSVQLQKALEAGSRESVSFLKDGKEQRYFIEANPQFKSVTVYDGHKKISLAGAIGGKTLESVKAVKEASETKESQKAGRRMHIT